MGDTLHSLKNIFPHGRSDCLHEKFVLKELSFQIGLRSSKSCGVGFFFFFFGIYITKNTLPNVSCHSTS